jgi:hypothetical protein
MDASVEWRDGSVGSESITRSPTRSAGSSAPARPINQKQSSVEGFSECRARGKRPARIPMVWSSISSVGWVSTRFRRKGIPKALAAARVSISKAARIISRRFRKLLFLQTFRRTRLQRLPYPRKAGLGLTTSRRRSRCPFQGNRLCCSLTSRDRQGAGFPCGKTTRSRSRLVKRDCPGPFEYTASADCGAGADLLILPSKAEFACSGEGRICKHSSPPRRDCLNGSLRVWQSVPDKIMGSWGDRAGSDIRLRGDARRRQRCRRRATANGH